LNTHPEQTCFLVMFRSAQGEHLARIVIESLRAFGGPLRGCPVWAFVLDRERVPHVLPGMEAVHRFPLITSGEYQPYPFADKVNACARAEEMAGTSFRSLAWLSLDCLVVNPPLLFDLSPSVDAAFRPVHHCNIGSPADAPLDGFWRRVYDALGIDRMPYTVESFADQQTLRPYFNTHCFAFDPAKGLCRAWQEHFRVLASEESFQAGPCRDELHQLFLHQAILSTLVAKMLDWKRVRLLPPEYNYPLNLQPQIPPDRRALALNDLVNAVYENVFPWNDIEVREPLRTWLRGRLPA